MTPHVKLAKFRLSFPLLALTMILAFWSLPSRADSVVFVDLANITYTGNNTCSGLPCKDVFNATFDWDATTKSVVAGSMNITNTGILGNMALYAIESYEIEFNSTAGSSYEAVSWYFGSSFPALGGYPLSQAYLYCDYGPCSSEFSTGTYISPTSGTIEVAAVPTPEPMGLLLVGTGLVALALLSRRWIGSPRHRGWALDTSAAG